MRPAGGTQLPGSLAPALLFLERFTLAFPSPCCARRQRLPTLLAILIFLSLSGCLAKSDGPSLTARDSSAGQGALFIMHKAGLEGEKPVLRRTFLLIPLVQERLPKWLSVGETRDSIT